MTNSKKVSRRQKQVKRIANALSMFKAAKTQLESVNGDIANNIDENTDEINSLQLENQELEKMQKENKRIIENLGQFVVNE